MIAALRFPRYTSIGASEVDERPRGQGKTIEYNRSQMRGDKRARKRRGLPGSIKIARGNRRLIDNSHGRFLRARCRLSHNFPWSAEHGRSEDAALQGGTIHRSLLRLFARAKKALPRCASSAYYRQGISNGYLDRSRTIPRCKFAVKRAPRAHTSGAARRGARNRWRWARVRATRNDELESRLRENGSGEEAERVPCATCIPSIILLFECRSPTSLFLFLSLPPLTLQQKFETLERR